MDAWIVTDDQELSARVSRSLDGLEVDCPDAQVVSIASLPHIAPQLAEACGVILLAVHRLSHLHFTLLKEIRSSCAGTLVVVSSIPDHATVLGAIRAGADDFIDADGGLERELVELVARLKQREAAAAPHGRLITVIPCGSPSDGNLLSVNIAAILAKQYGSCVLLDFHLRGGDMALMLKLMPRHTLLDLIRQPDSIDRPMLEQALTHHDSGIRLLAGPDMFSGLHDLHPQASRRILDIAQSMEQFVVVCVEDIHHIEQVMALAKSDKIVATMRLDLVSLHRMQKHLEYLRSNGVPTEHLFAAALGTGHEGELPVATVTKFLGIPLIHCIPDDPVSVTASINLGHPLALELPRSKSAKAILQFVHLLCGNDDAQVDRAKSSTTLWKSTAALALNSLMVNR